MELSSPSPVISALPTVEEGRFANLEGEICGIGRKGFLCCGCGRGLTDPDLSGGRGEAIMSTARTFRLDPGGAGLHF